MKIKRYLQPNLLRRNIKLYNFDKFLRVEFMLNKYKVNTSLNFCEKVNIYYDICEKFQTYNL
jgi:hypothetical protein